MGKYQRLKLLSLFVLSSLCLHSTFQLCQIIPFFEQAKTADLVVTAKVREYRYFQQPQGHSNWGLHLEIIHIYKGKSKRKFVLALQPLAAKSLKQGVFKLGSTWVFALKKGQNTKYTLLNCQGTGPLLAEKGYVYGCIAKKCDQFANKQEKMTHRQFSRELAEKLK